MPGEEVGVEGQREQPGQAQFAGGADQPLQQERADARAAVVRMHGQRAYLTQVGPQHVQRTAADDRAAALGDDEVLDVLVEGDQLLREQLAAGPA